MKARTLRLTISQSQEMPQSLWNGLEGFPFEDNSGTPDGDWLPYQPLDERDPGVKAILDAGYGEMVEARYLTPEELIIDTYGDSKELRMWLREATEEAERVAWDTAQNIATYAARYADIIVIANPLAVE